MLQTILDVSGVIACSIGIVAVIVSLFAILSDKKNKK